MSYHTEARHCCKFYTIFVHYLFMTIVTYIKLLGFAATVVIQVPITFIGAQKTSVVCVSPGQMTSGNLSCSLTLAAASQLRLTFD